LIWDVAHAPPSARRRTIEVDSGGAALVVGRDALDLR